MTVSNFTNNAGLGLPGKTHTGHPARMAVEREAGDRLAISYLFDAAKVRRRPHVHRASQKSRMEGCKNSKAHAYPQL